MNIISITSFGNKILEEELWTKVLNRSCEQLLCYVSKICEQKFLEKVRQMLWIKLWIKVVNESSEQELWTQV